MSESKPIPLDTPVKRGDTTIDSVTVTKPKSGALRGASLMGLMRQEVNDLIAVLPRVTTPSLTQHEVASLEPSDLLALGVEVSSFFLPKAVLADLDTPTA